LHGGEKQRDEHCNDGNHNQELDQREAASILTNTGTHGKVLKQLIDQHSSSNIDKSGWRREQTRGDWGSERIQAISHPREAGCHGLAPNRVLQAIDEHHRARKALFAGERGILAAINASPTTPG
jgi:hypothetical protein